MIAEEATRPTNDKGGVHWLVRKRGRGSHFTVNRAYLKLLRPVTCLVFCDLLNRAAAPRAKWQNDGDTNWFLCTNKYMESDWTKEQLKDAFNELIEVGFLLTQKRGVPPVRWVWFNIVKIDSLLSGIEQKRRENPMGAIRPEQGKYLLTEDTSLLENKNRMPRSGRTGQTLAETSMLLPLLLDTPVGMNVHARQVTQKDKERANRLRAYAAKNGWFVTRAAKRCGEAFSLLRSKLGAEEGKIDAALDFLINNKITKPQVCDGEQLRSPKVWNWVVQLMEKYEKQHPAVVIEPATLRAAKRLDMLGWPKGSEKDVATATQVCVDRVRKFRNHIISLTHRDDRFTKGHQLAFSTYVSNQLSPPHEVAEDHMRQVNRRVNRWPDWSGNLLALAWSADSDDFKRQLRGWADQRFGDASLADKLLKEVDGV